MRDETKRTRNLKFETKYNLDFRPRNYVSMMRHRIVNSCVHSMLHMYNNTIFTHTHKTKCTPNSRELKLKTTRACTLYNLSDSTTIIIETMCNVNCTFAPSTNPSIQTPPYTLIHWDSTFVLIVVKLIKFPTRFAIIRECSFR